jgi:endogenous inhibitor of DNA gyrase (YacG/DUF329 family)
LFAAENTWRPFCSERCRLIDLGNWASESYRVPEEVASQPDSEDSDDDTAEAR